MRSSNKYAALVLMVLVTTIAVAVPQEKSKQDGSARTDHAVTAAANENPTSNSTTPSSWLKQHPSRDDYVIGPNDLLSVDVWKEPEITKTVPVRSDGKISLPLIGDVGASGQTPRQLQVDITSRLQAYLSDPEVTVIVQDSRSRSFNVLGQIARPGSFLLNKPLTVLDAIALAGGFRDFAKQTKVYVLRRKGDGTQTRLPFNYKQVVKGIHPEQNIALQSDDTIVVP